MKGNVFAIERRRLNLTQEQLANKLNTSRSNVANWENRQNMPSVDLLIKCSTLFDCDVMYLAGYQKERKITNDDFSECKCKKKDIKALFALIRYQNEKLDSLITYVIDLAVIIFFMIIGILYLLLINAI